jgi:hypothetical protein
MRPLTSTMSSGSSLGAIALPQAAAATGPAAPGQRRDAGDRAGAQQVAARQARVVVVRWIAHGCLLG